MKRVWAISDSHCKHMFLDVPNNIDIVIHAGDESNQKSAAMNNNECLNFLEWYKSLYIKHKIYVAGNHSTAIGNGLITRGDIPSNITYLEHESVTIEGIKIFGSPYTPEFGTGWAFNVPRKNLKSYWEDIAADTRIVISHGPPKGILDLTMYDSRPGAKGDTYFQCGCEYLFNKVKKIEPEFVIFGHIHPEKHCPNAGILKIQNCETSFINACVVDLDYELHNNGFIFEIDEKQKSKK
jgi:Icc-related predicted phosphoesterase